MERNEKLNYEKIKEVSDEIYEELELNKYIINSNEKENSLIAKNNFFEIILKLYVSMKEDSNLSFSIQEIKFILDFEIYKYMKEIIERIQKI